MELKEYAISDIASLKYGKMLAKGKFTDSGHPVFSGYRITGYTSEYLYEEPEVIVVARGVGGTGDVKISPPKSWVTNLSIVLSVDTKLVDKFFFKEFLHAENLKSKLDSGASISQITINSLESYKVKLPDISFQRSVRDVLIKYDNIIENNNRRIAILEDMAQILYREWFVNFRYPNHEDNLDVDGNPKLIESPLGQIPEGWEVKKFSQVVNYKTGRLNSNAAVAGGEYPFFTCSRETFRTNTWSFDCECVLLAGNNANAIYPIKYFNGKFDAYQRTYVITEKNRDEITPSFLFYCLEIKLNQLKNISTGTSTRFLTKGILDNLDILIPTPELMSQFNSIVLSLLDSQGNLRKRNENLKQQRDMLLPKLISGQIELKD